MEQEPLLNEDKISIDRRRFVIASITSMFTIAAWSRLMPPQKKKDSTTEMQMPIPEYVPPESTPCIDLENIPENETLIGKSFRMKIPSKGKEKEFSVVARILKDKECGVYLEMNGNRYTTNDTVTVGVSIFAKVHRIADLVQDIHFDQKEKNFCIKTTMNTANISREKIEQIAPHMADRVPIVIIPRKPGIDLPGVTLPPAIIFKLVNVQSEEIASIQH